MYRFVLSVLTLAALLMRAAGQQEDPLAALAGGGPAGGDTRATLISEVAAIAPGRTFTVALRLEHPAEWHSYYRNSGGPELPPSIRWSLPEGFTAGDIRWPVPALKEGFFGVSQIYDGSPVFLIDITPPDSLETGSSVQLAAEATWQICKEACRDESASLTLSLETADEPRPDPAQADVFAEARGRLPLSADGWQLTAERSGTVVKLRATGPDGAVPDIRGFVSGVPWLSAVKPSSESAADGLLEIPLRTRDHLDEPVPAGDEVSGILLTGDGRGIAVEAVPLTKAPPPALPWGSFLLVIGGMFAGGLILNVMPCVFPVIGLKIMGFARQAGEEKGKIVMHGLVFTAGVLLSFWILCSILYAVRESSGVEIGWGYQLQNRWFVWSMMLLFLVFGLAMFGVFEFGAGIAGVGGGLQAKQGLAGSLFSGGLATIAATPCSAPVLGPAIGTAVTLPAVQFFAAFTAMALGLALPYLVLSIYPHLVRKLPRPGPWMESFKQAMSFLLLGTAAFFFWVYSDHVNADAQFYVVMGLVLIAMALWIYGRWNLNAPLRRRWIARVAALLIGATGVYGSTGPSGGIEWEPWSEARVNELLDEGRPVYVDFTAKWCATCQLNKKVAYTAGVIDLVRRKGIVMLRADKTKPSPEIEQAIAALGRAAIPVNAFYLPDGSDPVVTPEVLSPEYLLELFSKAEDAAD